MSALKTSGRGATKRPGSDSPVLELPLTGAAFIEASAGTGKTYALTSLVARLIVEGEGRTLDRILLVTFTNAATAELRDRVRRTLRSVLDAVRSLAAADPEGGDADSGVRTLRPDPQAAELLRAWEARGDFDPAIAARRLEIALHDIDRANIFTIHGFCQRMLGDFAFEGGLPFAFEMSGGDQDMIAREARDFWRRRFQDASLLQMRHVSGDGFYPDEIARWVSAWRAKINIEVRGGELSVGVLQAAETAWNGLYETTRVLWHEHRDELQREMLEGEWVDRRSYRKLKVEEDMNTLEAFFTTFPPRLPPEDQNKDKGPLTRYGRKILASKCKGGKELPENPLFDAFDRLKEESQALREIFDQSLRQARREALLEMRDSIRARIREERRLTYDDLLLELQAALEDGESGVRLAGRIRRAFPCALIDEYQDTDPVQTRIFERIYGSVESGADADERGGEGEDEGAEPAGAGHLFVVVGDPKQSIYRFRGADVFAYIAAREKVKERRTLLWNWRSVPALVDAMNVLFAGDDSFLTSEIGYSPVNAGIAEDDFHILPPGGNGGGRRTARGPGADPAADPADTPFRLWLVPHDEEGKPLNRGVMNQIVLSATADEIARLLARGERDEARIGERPLTGADIAVLTRTRYQGRRMAEELRERGVRCVEIDDASVFTSREAEQLERFLRALAEPGEEARVRGALAGDLFGLDADRMFALNENDEAWGAFREQFTAWRSEWEARGIGVLLRSLLDSRGGAQRLLERDDGLRRLTNFRHLAELLQEEEARQRPTPAELAVWLSRRRADAGRHSGQADDDTRLRLSSDEHLVRIMTIHMSKGLEFPVVFCPFLWSVPGEKSQDATYHLGAEDGYREVLNLGTGAWSAWTWGFADMEEFAESLRLAYVALTRAKYRCVVAWGNVADGERSPLAWLLHRHRAPSEEECAPQEEEGVEESEDAQRWFDWIEDYFSGMGLEVRGSEAEEYERKEEALSDFGRVKEYFKGLGPDAWIAEVEEYADRCPDNAVAVEVLDTQEASPPVRVPAKAPSGTLTAREPTRALRRVRQMTSFTGLSRFAAEEAGAHAVEEESGAEAERPDHDEREAWSPAVAGGQPAEEEGAADAGEEGGMSGEHERDAPRTAFTFPRGATVGKYVHRIFEHLDDPSGAPGDPDRIHDDASREFGIDPVWQPVVRAMVERTREVPLAASEGGKGGFRLADPLRRLVELEFSFPVKGLAYEQLGALLAAHDYPDPFAGGSGQDGAEEDGAGPPPIDGFLRGFIDLTIEHDGRWYIVDYKSNWLGPAPEDYSPEKVAQAMRAGRYQLQYLLYVVALHRYLGLRLADYDYERHLGGVFYLFVRGIDPAAGPGRGIFFDRPTLACVSALDDFFREGAA